MIIHKVVLDECYKQILKSAVDKSCSVLILCATDADAVCACRIFTSLLRSDQVSYKILAVGSYEDMNNVLQEEDVQNNEDIQSIVMFNCGGIVDIETMFPLRNNITVFVVDSHRPFNLRNVQAENTQVRLLDDADDDDEYPSEPDESDSEEDEEDSEDDLDSGDERPPKKRKTNRSADERNRRREQYKRIEEYYAASYHGASASLLMWNLAVQLSKANNDLLWLAIVGVTEQFVFERVDMDKYTNYVLELQRDVARFNINQANQEDVDPNRMYDDHDDDDWKQTVPLGRITFVPREYRFMLLRHWNLYDSMLHSQYVASRLRVWKENGRQSLSKLLAMMGVPLTECKQDFTFMLAKHKETLADQLKTLAPRFGLSDVMFPSFERRHTAKFVISAADMVFCVTALLENPYPEDSDPFSGSSNRPSSRAGSSSSSSSGSGGSSSMGPGKGNDAHDAKDMEDDEEEAKENSAAQNTANVRRNFWRAYDSLSSKHSHLLKEGLKLSIELQRAVVRQGTSVIEKKQLRRSPTFRYVELTTGSPDAHLFQQPLALSKLALFLADAHRDKRNFKDLVVCAQNEERGTCLVVGVPAQRRFGFTRKNLFGKAFREAAETADSRVRHDGFETAFIEIQTDDLKRFIEVLCYNTYI